MTSSKKINNKIIDLVFEVTVTTIISIFSLKKYFVEKWLGSGWEAGFRGVQGADIPLQTE